VRYFLCDDTVELIEIRKPNDGRDRFSCLWKRARLPRELIFHDSRSRDIEADKGDGDYYSVADLRVGGSINVLGRSILLYDAERKTYDWVEVRPRGMGGGGGGRGCAGGGGAAAMGAAWSTVGKGPAQQRTLRQRRRRARRRWASRP
jgi:hypothetical protein